jgi:hypothetical protein
MAPGHSVSQDAERVEAAASRANDPNDLRAGGRNCCAPFGSQPLPRRRRIAVTSAREIPLVRFRSRSQHSRWKWRPSASRRGHRSRAAQVLLDLSPPRRSQSLVEALREAMSFVMEFPSLGRRMVPLLLPYLDRAA